MECNGLQPTPWFRYHLTNLSLFGASMGIPEILKIGRTRDAIAMLMIKLSIIFPLFRLKIRNTTFLQCAQMELLNSGKAKIRSKTLNIKKSFSSAKPSRGSWTYPAWWKAFDALNRWLWHERAHLFNPKNSFLNPWCYNLQVQIFPPWPSECP
jgi:hypothetical protein